MVSKKASAYEKLAEKKLFNGEVVQEFKLKNGFKVLLVERHQSQVLTYQVWFHVGSVDEKLDPKLKKTGLAHLFEHMMFRGSQKYPDGKFDELVSQLGGDKQNATTYFYRTNYYESMPSMHLEKIMELEADRMQYLNLTQDLFEKEKGAVVGEFRRHLDNPGSVLHDLFLSTAYEKAPYRYTVLGTEEEIKGFTLDEAKYFYKTFYAPNNATLIVVGDTTENRLLPLAEKYYGSMEPQAVPKSKIPEEPPQKKERMQEGVHPQATSEYLLMGYHIPGVNDKSSVPLNILSTHLSTGMEARLRKTLVDKGIAVGAHAAVSFQPDLFQITVQLAHGKKAAAALKVIEAEIKKIQSEGVDKDSFVRAQNQELLQLYSSIGDNPSMGEFLGEFLMLSGNYLRGFELIEGYKSATPSDLKKAAKDFLKPSNRIVAILKPPAKKG